MAGRAERRHVLGVEVLHLVDEDRDLADVGGEAADVGEELDEVDLDVTGVGAAGHGRHVDAGLPAVAQLGGGGGLAQREGLDDAEHLVGHLVTAGMAELAHGLVGRGGEGLRSRWSGRASNLPVPQLARTAELRSALSSTVLPTPRRPVSTIDRSERPRAIRSSTTSKVRNCSSRPASSGGADPRRGRTGS